MLGIATIGGTSALAPTKDQITGLGIDRWPSWLPGPGANDGVLAYQLVGAGGQ